jgi:hypothetical protein
MMISQLTGGLVHGTICESRTMTPTGAEVDRFWPIRSILAEFAAATVKERAHARLAILATIVAAAALLLSSGSVIAETVPEKQARCELSAIRDTRSALAVQFIRSACNWLALYGDSLLNESGVGYHVCLVRELSGVQADQGAGIIVSACRTSNPL